MRAGETVEWITVLASQGSVPEFDSQERTKSTELSPTSTPAPWHAHPIHYACTHTIFNLKKVKWDTSVQMCLTKYPHSVSYLVHVHQDQKW